MNFIISKRVRFFLKKYWLKIIFFSNLKIIFWVLRMNSNRSKRYFFNNSFFQITKFWFISCWTMKNNSLCHFKTSFFKQKEKTRNIVLCFSNSIICRKRRIKNFIVCFVESYIIMFWNRKILDCEIREELTSNWCFE